MGVKCKYLSFKELWDAKPPKAAKGESLQVYMKDVGHTVRLHNPANDC